MEERLAELDADMYFKSATQSLEKLLKNSGLEGGNMSQEIQQAIDDFKANPTVENQEKAEGLICRDEADRGLIEICQKVETRVKKGNLTEEEKKDLIDEIQRFISKNYYQKTAYSHRKQEVDDLLERLSNLEEQDNNEQSFLEKYFWPIVIVNFSLIVVVFIVWNLSKRKVRNKNY
jgi:lipopolysaccharide export LptBFGC system permease protein LptF